MDQTGTTSGGLDVTASLQALTAFVAAYWFPIAALLTIFGLAKLLKSSTMVARLWRNLEDNVLHNWRLVLLGLTGIILSLASGWTTWDGMRNFTHEPLLSLMITFGIQGVMLIAAWLIGESFATGMNQKTDGGISRSGTETAMGTAIGVLLFIAIASWAMKFLNVQETVAGVQAGVNWSNVANSALILVIALLALASLLVNRKSDVVGPYLQGSRVIAKNAVLWVMFLACMGTSVFFSFDSLFSNIFPQSERKRAAQIRTTNQVAGIVADIGTQIARRRLVTAEALFTNPAWDGYEQQLSKLSALAETAPGAIREQIRRELEEQNRQLKALQEKRANAESSQAGLASRKNQLSEEISRLSGLRPEAMQATLEPKATVALIQKELDEQRAKTLAEERGVEGSLKVGRGAKYRESKGLEELIASKLEVARQRLKSAEDRLRDIDRRVAAGKGELAQIDGDLAKLKGEASTAEQLIAVAQGNNSGTNAGAFDPAAGLAQLDRDRQAFRQNPTQKSLAAIQTTCGTVHSAMMRVASLKDRAAGISCDPGPASEAAANLFALNQGIAAFEANCAGGSKLPQTGGTDAMLSFGRQCLQDSGLTSTDSAALGSKLSSVELARDDKAHRFVVTWNAFQDGNSLAYLALAIAIAIDSLVFMSGLFGANVVRSPLSDVPTLRSRTAKELDSIITAALGNKADRLETAQIVLAAMHPITPHEGFTSEVVLDGNNAHQDDRVRKLLNAGATIGAVRRTRPGHYEVRSELFEFLSGIAARELESNKDHVRQSDLDKVIGVALLPDVGANAENVLSHMHPINEQNGFTSEIFVNEVDPAHVRPVRNVLNAGSTFQVVQRDSDDAMRYYIHADLYKTLARIRARTLFQPGYARPQIAAPAGPAYGGDITDKPKAITGAAPAAAQITHDLADDGAKRPVAAPAAAAAPLSLAASVERDLKAALGEHAVVATAASDDSLDPYTVLDYDIPRLVLNLFGERLRLNDVPLSELLDPSLAHEGSLVRAAIERVISIDPDMCRMIEGLDDRNAHALLDAKKEVAADPKLRNDIKQADRLVTFFQKIMPMVLLVDGGAYETALRSLIARVESGDHVPDHVVDEHLWLQALQDHSDNLHRQSRRGHEGWVNASKLLNQFADKLQQLQEAADHGLPGEHHLLN